MEELKKKNEDENEKTEIKEETEVNSEAESVKIKLGTVGNFVLLAFIILIIGTGALTYYLIHSAKDDYDKQYNEIVSDLIKKKQKEKIQLQISLTLQYQMQHLEVQLQVMKAQRN